MDGATHVVIVLLHLAKVEGLQELSASRLRLLGEITSEHDQNALQWMPCQLDWIPRPAWPTALHPTLIALHLLA